MEEDVRQDPPLWAQQRGVQRRSGRLGQRQDVVGGEALKVFGFFFPRERFQVRWRFGPISRLAVSLSRGPFFSSFYPSLRQSSGSGRLT